PARVSPVVAQPASARTLAAKAGGNALVIVISRLSAPAIAEWGGRCILSVLAADQRLAIVLHVESLVALPGHAFAGEGEGRADTGIARFLDGGRDANRFVELKPDGGDRQQALGVGA